MPEKIYESAREEIIQTIPVARSILNGCTLEIFVIKELH